MTVRPILVGRHPHSPAASPQVRSRPRHAAFRTFIVSGFAGRIVGLDSACAEGYATVRTRREAAGLSISLPDALIAGAAFAHGATVATRKTGDFAGCGLTVVDPWQAT